MTLSRILFLLYLCPIGLIVSLPAAKQEKAGALDLSGAAPAAGSTVSISVGEKYWAYTLNGRTDTPYKIAISGQYYNNEAAYSGLVQLYLLIDVGITRYDAVQRGSTMQFLIQSFDRFSNRWNNFNFEVICPQPATSNDLRYGMINATTLFVMGPSRSALQ